MATRINILGKHLIDPKPILWYQMDIMKSLDEQILRTTKEIVVKFVEMGRLSPSSIHESFRDIYATVSETVKGEISESSSDRESIT